MKKIQEFCILLVIIVIALLSCEKVTLVSIEVTTQPAKKTYTVGDVFDITGMLVTAIYNDESRKHVTVTADMLSYDFRMAGSDKTVTITYKDKTASVTEITVIQPEVTLTSITISGYPVKTEYFVNERFVPIGITVTAIYSDDSTAKISFYELNFIYSFTTTGTDITVTVSFTYKGITKTAEIKGITVTNIKEYDLGSLQKIFDGYVVQAIAFDSKGNAWIGTQGKGLIRYNENETIFYNPKNSVLSDDFIIWDMAVDKNDNVWIGVSCGVWKFDGEEFTLYNSKNTAMPEDIVWKIAVDSKNNIWMASCRFRQGGLVKYDGTEWTAYTPDNSLLPANSIHGITVDQLDNVWLSSGDYVNEAYLVKISNDRWDVFDKIDFGFTPYYFGEIQFDSKNRLWGAIDYSLSSTMINFPHFFIFDGEKSTQLSCGDYWRNAGSLSGFTIDHNDYVWCFEGSTNGVWIDEKWSILGSSAFNGSKVWVIKEDRDHKIWFGTGNGIYIKDNCNMTNGEIKSNIMYNIL